MQTHKLDDLIGRLSLEGYKVLLKQYECSLGEIDLIAKKNGKLFFIMVDQPITKTVEKVGNYYLKRYGIGAVEHEFLAIKDNAKQEGL